MIRHCFRVAAVAALLAGLSTHAAAQVPPAQTGQASPGRVEDQLQLPDTTFQAIPRIQVRELEIKGAPAGSEDIVFTLRELNLEGVTVYSTGDLAPLYADKLGKSITLADLYGIAADLTRKYRNDGYLLTQVVVPPQTIEGGSARLQVVEGYIDNIEIQSDEQGRALDTIRHYAAEVRTQGAALNVSRLERTLLLINDLPGVDAQGILSPSPDTPGAADLIIVVNRDMFEGFASIDNHGSRYLGPIQITTAANVNSVLGMNERLTGQFTFAPTENIDPELYYFGLNYEQPVFNKGTIAEAFFNESLTDPGYDLKPFDVKGRGIYTGLRLRHPFIRTRALNLTGRFTLDYRNVDTWNNIEATRTDHIRAARLGGRLEFVDTWFSAAYNVLDLEISQGLDIFGANNKNDPNVSRVAAQPVFTKMEAEVQRLQRILPDVNLLLAVSGQMSSRALYSAEEFGVGGLAYGRGFDSSEIIGDHGIAGKAELQWNNPVKLAVSNYQLYGFYDAGRIWNEDPAANALKSDTLSSAGMGIRLDITPATTAGFLLAFPLNRDVQTQNDRDPRPYLSLSHKF